MRYAVMCLDKPHSLSLRDATRARHIEYLLTKREIIHLAGPLSSDDGVSGIGSFYVLEIADRSGAEAFLAAEPYNRAGLFETVSIYRWRQAIPELSEDALRQEFERAKTAPVDALKASTAARASDRRST